MKILILCNKVPYPANDGSTIAMASMIDGLMANNAEVHALCFNTAKHFRDDQLIAKHKPDQLRLKYTFLDNRIKPLGVLRNLFEKNAFQVSRFRDKRFTQMLESEIATHDYDLIQLEGLTMAVYLNSIRQMTGARVVLRAHNVEYQIWQRHLEAEKNPLKRAYLNLQNKRLKKFEEAVSYEVDAIVSITDEDLQQFRRIQPSKVAISIPCGIKLEHYPPCAEGQKEYDLVYIASFDWLPNQQGIRWFLREVWPLLTDRRPSIRFRLGGRNMPVDLREQADKNLSVETAVNDMREFMCSGKLAVVPLLAGSGMRIKILENMALGICQVTTRVGAEGIDAKPGEDIIIADEAEEMAAAILSLLDTPQRIGQIGLQARQAAISKYANDSLGRKLVEFYETEVCI